MTSKNNPYYPLPIVSDIIYTQKRFTPRTPSNSPPRRLESIVLKEEGTDLNNMLKTFQTMIIDKKPYLIDFSKSKKI